MKSPFQWYYVMDLFKYWYTVEYHVSNLGLYQLGENTVVVIYTSILGRLLLSGNVLGERLLASLLT